MAMQTTHLILGPEDHGRAVSAEEFAAAEMVQPWTYERADGRLIVVAPDGYAHQTTSEPWRDALVLYKRDHPGVIRYVFSNPWLRPDAGSDRVGDIGVFLAATPPREAGEPVPDIVFEIVSPGRESRERDYVHKRDEYHRLGIREYVIVDRFDRTVMVLTHEPGGYAERLLGEPDAYTTDLLPGLRIPLAEVF